MATEEWKRRKRSGKELYEEEGIVSVSWLLNGGSENRSKLLEKDGLIVDILQRGKQSEENGCVSLRKLKITHTDRERDAVMLYKIMFLGGFEKNMPNDDSVLIANDPRHRDKSFKIEWVN